MKFKIGDKVRIERINEVISDDVMKKYRGSIGYITSESKYDNWVKLTVDNERYNWYEGWLELVEDNVEEYKEKLEYALQLLGIKEEELDNELRKNKENNEYRNKLEPLFLKIETELSDICNGECDTCIYYPNDSHTSLTTCNTRKVIHYLYKEGYLKLDK